MEVATVFLRVSRCSVRSLVLLTALCLALAAGLNPSLSNPALAQSEEPPLPPTGLEVTLENYYSVSISWDDSGDNSITGYQVLRRSRDGDTYGDGQGAAKFVAIEDNTGDADTEYTDTSVSPETRYVYRVKARNSAGLSGRSNYARANTPGVPESPTGLNVSSASHASITISWDDPGDHSITGYQVLRRSRDGDAYGDGHGAAEFVAIEDNTGDADTEYTDTSVSPETRYVYRVKARNPAGLSGRSSYANAETQAAPVLAPQPTPGPTQEENQPRGQQQESSEKKAKSEGSQTPRQQQTSSDATLSSITVDGSAVSGVGPGATEFLFRVENSTNQVTLAATPGHSNANVSFSPLDADDILDGHQVNLKVGGNSVTVTVTAEDGVTTAYYTLTINRASTAISGWAVLPDIEDVLGYGESPGGIWSDGTYMWVSGGDYLMLYAYELATGDRESDRDIGLASVNTDPKGIWSDGETMWVLDNEDRMLYAYNLENGARDEEKDFGAFGDEDDDYYGVWSDGRTVWISNSNGGVVEAYDFSSGEEKPELKYNALEPSGQDHTAGIWSDGVTMWVADPNRKFIFAYDAPKSELNQAKGFRRLIAAGNTSPRDIWSDGETMWVADSEDGKVYSYNMPVSNNAELRTLIAGGRVLPGFEPDTHSYSRGVPSRVNQVAVQGVPRQHFASVSFTPEDSDTNLGGYQVELETGANVVTITVLAQDGVTTENYTVSINREDPAPFGWKTFDDFDTLYTAGNRSPGGLASDGSTMWIADEVDLKLYAYDLVKQARNPDLDVTLDPAQDSPGGMWLDGATILVYDVRDRKLYAYSSETGDRDESKDLDWPEVGFSIYYGVWSDGDTLWFSQKSGGLVAYDLGTGTRAEHKDFDALEGTEGINARGIWSDGAIMWVVDKAHDKIRALNMLTGEPEPDKDFQTIRNGDLGGTFGLWSDGETMWVSDSVANKVYSYNMPVSDSADLRKVVVDDVEAAGSTQDGAWYSTVDSAATQATVAWAAAQLKATSSHDSADNDTDTDGHQLGIPHLAAKMAITVTAQSGDTREHTLVVSRVNTDSAPKVRVGGSATGDIAGAELFDVFAVDLVTDELYRFNLEGVDNGDGALTGPKLMGLFKLVHGTAVPVGDTADFPGGQGANSSEVYHEPKPDGQAKATKATYYIVVGGGTGATGGYRLSVSYEDEATADTSTGAAAEVLPSHKSSGKRGRHHFRGAIGEPGDVDWIKVTLEEDQMYRIVVKSAAGGNYRTISEPILIGLYTGDETANYIQGTLAVPSGLQLQARIHYYAKSAGVYYASVMGFADDMGSYDLLVMEVEDDCQPDNSSTHDSITVGESKNARIDYRGDTDWFRTSLTGGTTYTVEASEVEGAGKLRSPKVLIYDGTGKMVATGKWKSGTKSSVVTFTPEQDGTYFIVVRSSIDWMTGAYEVSLSE